jgi:hypothetical protein
MECISTLDTNNSENEIKIKPNYTSLLNFAYFGSCVDLIRTSFNNLINNFPAELYISNNPNEINPMDINIYSQGGDIIDNGNLKNISTSFKCYEALDENSNYKGEIEECTVAVKNSNKCLSAGTEVAVCTIKLEKGETVIIRTKSDGKGGYVYSVTKGGGVRIRPKKEYIKKKLSELSEFEKKDVIKAYAPLCKTVFGMSTRKAQTMIALAQGKKKEDIKTKTSEGIEKEITVDYTVAQWTENFIDYLRSTMSYCNFTEILDFVGGPDIMLLSESAKQSINK